MKTHMTLIVTFFGPRFDCGALAPYKSSNGPDAGQPRSL